MKTCESQPIGTVSKPVIIFQSYLLLHSFLCLPLNTAIKGMIQKRYDPMSRHVKRVRSQLDAVLLCAVREELLKTWGGNSVQVQLRSPVYPAMGFCLQRERKPAPFLHLRQHQCMSARFPPGNTVCELEWNRTRCYNNHTRRGVPRLENRPSEPITDQHAVGCWMEKRPLSDRFYLLNTTARKSWQQSSAA